MATAVKRILSGTTNGRPLKLSATSTPGTLVHTAVSGTTPGMYDEIWLWAHNSSASSVTITVEFGGTSAPDDTITTTLASKEGLVPILPGLILQNGCIVRAFAGTTNVITVVGFVNSITD